MNAENLLQKLQYVPRVLEQPSVVTYTDIRINFIGTMHLDLGEDCSILARLIIEQDPAPLTVFSGGVGKRILQKNCEPATIAALLVLIEQENFTNNFVGKNFSPEHKLSAGDLLRRYNASVLAEVIARGRAELHWITQPTNLSQTTDPNILRVFGHEREVFIRMVGSCSTGDVTQSQGSSATMPERIVRLWSASRVRDIPSGYQVFHFPKD